MQNSDDEDNSDELGERTTGSEGHSPRGAEARTPRRHPEAGSAYYMPQRTVDTVFDDHYL